MMEHKSHTLVEQKSLLAKLMAAENITVEHKQVPTAAFDMKNRVLYLPILKWEPGSDVYDLFCAHEVGHALWTPFEGWHSSASTKGSGYKSFLNVVEDARIEKKIKRKFAGAGKCMKSGYSELMNEDFFGLRKMGVDPNELGLIDRINLYTKAGGDYGVDFTDEEKEWVEKVERTETFEDVIEVTDALYKYCKENESETDNSHGDFGEMSDENYEDSDSDSDESGENGDQDVDDPDIDLPSGFDDEDGEEEDGEKPGMNASNDSDEDSDESGENTSDDESGSDSDSEENSEDENDTDGTSKTSSGFEGGASDPFSDRKSFEPRSRTDDEYREREVELADMGDEVVTPLYLTFPKINLESIIVDYKKVHDELTKYYTLEVEGTEFSDDLLKKFKFNNDKMINYMVKEFEMKKAAYIHRRAYTSKKGTLDMNKIHAYKYSENLFQQVTHFPEGKNHGMVMFIDWSGSMSTYMKETIEQLINLTMFCSKVQIPFDVYAFTDHYREKEMLDKYVSIPDNMAYSGEKIAEYKKNDLVITQNLRFMHLFSSRMRKNELTRAYRNMLMVAHAYSSNHRYYYSSGEHTYYGMPNNFTLGGTPLDDTVVVAKTLLEEFKMKSRVQIVNAVFLTDGASNRLHKYKDVDSISRPFPPSFQIYLDDPATRTRVNPVEGQKRRRSHDLTPQLLTALKKMVGVNLLGFFLTSANGRNKAGVLAYVLNRYPTQDEMTAFRKDKFLIEKGTAYDELYVINTKGLEIDEENHMDSVKAGSSKSEIRKALKKNTKGKLQNRVLLNAFIDKVA